MTETNDNGKSMRASHPHSDHALHERIQSEYREMPGMRLTAQQAARLFNLEILDGVYNNIGDAQGFARECSEARDMGFDGKTLIHPSQIEVCNAAFSPSAEEVAEAQKIIAVFDQPANKDKGVVELDGRMVERMHADMARRTVAIADAIATQR